MEKRIEKIVSIKKLKKYSCTKNYLKAGNKIGSIKYFQVQTNFRSNKKCGTSLCKILGIYQ